jgi:hypothetical protein
VFLFRVSGCARGSEVWECNLSRAVKRVMLLRDTNDGRISSSLPQLRRTDSDEANETETS